jgi:hypothetical protein
MIDVLNLALPFFGLIFIGFACGRIKQIPDTALGWMNFFIVYVSLPALFYRILAQTPLEQLARIDFILATTLATFMAFAISFGIGMAFRKGNIAESTIAGLAGGYGNIGYMGPGLALATLGQAAAVPVALIFCFDNIALFTLVPFLMALARPKPMSVPAITWEVFRRVAGHPLIVASALGVASASVHFQPPRRGRPSVAIPAERGGALRAVRARRDGRAAAIESDPVGDPVPRRGEAGAASRRRLPAALPVRTVRAHLGGDRGADGGASAGSQRLRVRAAVRCLGRAGVERGAGRDNPFGCDADQRDVAGEDRQFAGASISLM